jgi:hypothetical protein
MKQWYLFYNQPYTKLHQLGAEIENTKLQQVAAEILHQRGGEKLQQPVGEFEQLKERMELLQKEMRETKRLMKANK